MSKLTCVMIILWGVAICAACGSKTNSPSSTSSTASPPMASSTADDLHYDDPCSLLEPKEVEAILGAPLGAPPFRGSNNKPSAEGPDCIYETANFHRIDFSVDFKDGGQAYRIAGFAKKLFSNAPTEKAKSAFMMDDGTELTGEWDEAQLIAMNCCIFVALRGDQMITIDFSDSDVELKQAAGLVDAAFKRIDKPLKVDGGANIAAAKALENTRPKPVDACSLVPQKDAEAILGPLTAAPKSDNTSSCTYPIPHPAGAPPRDYDLTIRWQGGLSDLRSTLHVGRVAGGALVVPKEMEKPVQKAETPLPPVGGPNDPWERAGWVDNDFVAIKKDVEIKMDKRLLDKDKMQALIGAAMRKI
jgi:hypothetical protein